MLLCQKCNRLHLNYCLQLAAQSESLPLDDNALEDMATRPPGAITPIVRRDDNEPIVSVRILKGHAVCCSHTLATSWISS